MRYFTSNSQTYKKAMERKMRKTVNRGKKQKNSAKIFRVGLVPFF